MSKRLTTEEFTARARKVHGDRYDYARTEYHSMHEKVTITCPVHGDFEQRAKEHLDGRGCARCNVKGRPRKTTEQWVAEARQIHGDRYDYSQAEYRGAHEKVAIICPKHGAFRQSATEHLKGRGCPECARETISRKKRWSKEEFVRRAREKHGDKYDYSHVSYQGSTKKVRIMCPRHGMFEQTPTEHLRRGCPKCNYENRRIANKQTTRDFVRRARGVHGDKYDYSKANYVHANEKVEIICPEHGNFWQRPAYHLLGGGCPKCSVDERTAKRALTLAEFMERANAIHGGKYDYSTTAYTNRHSEITIICPTHGPFRQLAGNHLQGSGCPKCAATYSKAEEEFIATFASNHECTRNHREFGLEIDGWFPNERVGLEYHGMPWHTERYVPRNRHKEKADMADRHGFRLIQVFDFEWNNKRPIVERIIRAALGEHGRTSGAREWRVGRIPMPAAREFLERYHLNGCVGGSPIALYNENEIAAVMTFRKKDDGAEIARFAASHHIAGAIQRLVAFAKKEFGWSRFYSFVDRRYFTGRSFISAGFEPVRITEPNYWYVDTRGGVIGNRLQFQKHKLKRFLGDAFDPSLSEAENMHRAGFVRLFDAGHMLLRL